MNEKLISKSPWLTYFGEMQDFIKEFYPILGKKTFLLFIWWKVKKLKLDKRSLKLLERRNVKKMESRFKPI